MFIQAGFCVLWPRSFSPTGQGPVAKTYLRQACEHEPSEAPEKIPFLKVV